MVKLKGKADASKEKEIIVSEKYESSTTIINEVDKNNNSTTEGNNNKSEDAETNKPIRVIRTFFQTIFQTRLFVVLVGILLVLKTILLYRTAIFNTKPLEYENIHMAAVFIFVFMIPPMFFKDKLRFWFALVEDLLISMLLFVNELYYSYSANLVSVSQISNLQYGREISIALPHLLNIHQILYFLDIIIVLIVFFALKIKIKKHSKLTYIIGIFYLFIAVDLSSHTVVNWVAEASKFQYNKILQIEASSIFGYHFLDVENNVNMKKNVKYKTKSSMLEAYDALMKKYDDKYDLIYDFSEIAKDKNVIIVQLESVQNFVANRKINGREITPNLNKFLNENIEFTNMQNQSYSTTADSEFTVMNSLYPLENGMSYAQYSSNDYNNIYVNFKKNDYSTTYIHGNVGSFWNREAVYSRLPIDNLIFDDVFDENVERINGYVSDEEVYKKIIDEIKKYDGKFLVNIVAASSHTAFDLPGLKDKERKVNIDVGDEYRGEYFGNYLEAVNYADYAFGIFIDELKKEGIYDDTVILVYGDHAGLQMYNWEMQDFIKEVQPLNDVQTQINYSNILCGLKIPGVDSMKIDKPISKIDIKPTIMEICGLKDQDEFSIGQSMFSNKDFVCINNGKIITDKYFYDGDWYEIETGKQLNLNDLSQEEIGKLNDYVDSLQKELDISLSANILNLLKK